MVLILIVLNEKTFRDHGSGLISKMIDDNYFDAALLIGDSNIAFQMHQEEFLKLNFENKVGLLIAKITNEALEDNDIKFIDVSNKHIFAAIAFFHHWTSVLISSYITREGKQLNKEWGAKSFINFFTLNKNVTPKYIAEQYTTTNKQLVNFFKDTDEAAKEITETYSTLIAGYVQHKGLNFKKNIDFRKIFKLHMISCFDMLVPD